MARKSAKVVGVQHIVISVSSVVLLPLFDCQAP